MTEHERDGKLHFVIQADEGAAIIRLGEDVSDDDLYITQGKDQIYIHPDQVMEFVSGAQQAHRAEPSEGLIPPKR